MQSSVLLLWFNKWKGEGNEATLEAMLKSLGMPTYADVYESVMRNPTCLSRIHSKDSPNCMWSRDMLRPATLKPTPHSESQVNNTYMAHYTYRPVTTRMRVCSLHG